MDDLHQTGCADAHPRMKRVRRPLAAVLALACLGLATAAPASGSVTVGQVPTDPPPNLTCQPGDYLQPSVTGGNLYIAKQAGRITSWTTYSGGAGTYTFKVFRRTSDPDVFQVIAHADAQSLSAGLLTFPADIAVRSGDMIGFNKGTAGSSCAVTASGDAVLLAPGDLGDGATGAFQPLTNRRLNVAANLVPSNEFSVTQITRNRHQGTATIIVQVPNPGVFTLSGKGLKKPQVSRNVVGAGHLTFQLAAAGGPKRKLLRKGAVKVAVGLLFAPTGGDPSTQALPVKLQLTRAARPVKATVPAAE
jgi:hypothetical protein